MNARFLSGCASAFFVLAVTGAVLSTDVPQAQAQARSVLPPPPGARLPWSPDRPPGVPPNRWIPISGTLGIVIVHTGPPVVQPGDEVPQSLEGYFAVRHAGRWWRLLNTSASLMPLGAIAQD